MQDVDKKTVPIVEKVVISSFTAPKPVDNYVDYGYCYSFEIILKY
jgi:hypothetical protein